MVCIINIYNIQSWSEKHDHVLLSRYKEYMSSSLIGGVLLPGAKNCDILVFSRAGLKIHPLDHTKNLIVEEKEAKRTADFASPIRPILLHLILFGQALSKKCKNIHH